MQIRAIVEIEMARRGEGERSRSGSESESESESGDKMSEYEKKRLSRIAENRARLEALGICKAAKALGPPSLKPRRKPISGREDEEDEDYRPEDDTDEEIMGKSSSSLSRKRKNKTTSSAPKRNKDLIRDDDDYDLNKAIALSLQDSVAGDSHTKNYRNHLEPLESCNKKKPDLIVSKMQMTADELVLYFFLFDKAGKGFITLRDVATMATVHDFTWSDEELQDMIRCFDLDKDGKLSLDEFRKVVTRCRLLSES